MRFLGATVSRGKRESLAFVIHVDHPVVHQMFFFVAGAHYVFHLVSPLLMLLVAMLYAGFMPDMGLFSFKRPDMGVPVAGESGARPLFQLPYAPRKFCGILTRGTAWSIRFVIYFPPGKYGISGLWRSWERASIALKRSRVRIPPGPLFDHSLYGKCTRGNKRDRHFGGLLGFSMKFCKEKRNSPSVIFDTFRNADHWY